jgi:rpsU-divergently transcribed protein
MVTVRAITVVTKKLGRSALPILAVLRHSQPPKPYEKNPAGGVPRVEFSTTASCTSPSSNPTAKRALSVDPDASRDNASESRVSTAPTLEGIRLQLVESALQQVHQYGWTRTAIIVATAMLREQHGGRWSLSVAGTIKEPEELIFEQMRIWRERLERDLCAAADDEPRAPGRRAERAIRTRLGYMRPFLESGTWSTAMAMGAHPLHAAETASQLGDLLAAVSGYCLPQDTASGSLAFQAQQASLGAIYMATELHILTDTYPYCDTWDFLHQRIAEWEALWGGSDAHPFAVPLGGGAPSLSPTDALTIAWTVSAAVASGIHSVLSPQAAAASAEAVSSPSALLRQLNLPKELPVLPVLGAPPAPLSSLWTAAFDDDSTTSSSATWGTLPSHYEDPAPRPST